jgi:hypothetical protein
MATQNDPIEALHGAFVEKLRVRQDPSSRLPLIE